MSGESLSAHHWSESNVLERGYNFENAQAIYPHLELPKTGPTSQFCSELAERLKCYVFAGYPERLVGDEAESSEEPEVDAKTETPSETRLVGANSAVLYSPEGEWIGHYRKTNLFETDKTWAKAGEYPLYQFLIDRAPLLYFSLPGTGFATFHLPSPLHTVCFGICNDLNPATSDPWTVEDGPYEIADYALSQNSDILILINAWLDSRNEEEEDNDWHTLNYWAARLRPLWVKDTSESSDKSSEEEDGEAEDGVDKKEIIVGVCNRTGEENGN